MSLDPLAASFADVSPYNYVLGNPIVFIDPSGMAPEGWSEDNKDLANRFGVFGGGDETYDDWFGNDQSNGDPVLTSGNVTSEISNEGPDYYPSSVEDFAEEVNKLPAAPKSKRNVVTIVIELPYSKSTFDLMGSMAWYMGNIKERSIAEQKAKISVFPPEIREPISNILDTNDLVPHFDLNHLFDSYNYTRNSLENSGIKRRYDTEIKINITNVGCSQSGSNRCGDIRHTNSQSTNIYYNFSWKIPRA